MLAVRVRPPWRFALFTTLVLAAGRMMVCAPSPTRCPGEARGSVVELHVKLRSEGTEPYALRSLYGHASAASARLFTQLEADVHDDRARWIRVTARSEASGEQLVGLLMRDPLVEQAFVAPEIGLPTTDLDPRDRLDGSEACPVQTPSFESYQGYLGPAPQGHLVGIRRRVTTTRRRGWNRRQRTAAPRAWSDEKRTWSS